MKMEKGKIFKQFEDISTTIITKEKIIINNNNSNININK
jgi:hypothetical protein